MKKSVSIWLMFVLLAPAVITVSWLSYQKKVIKREVKWTMIAGLDNEELVLLKFTKEDSAKLRWEHSREFEHQGEMYDIVEQIAEGDTTYYYCWWDHEETVLNKKLQTLLTRIWQSNSNKKKQEDHLIALYKSLFVSNEAANLMSSTQTFLQHHPLKRSFPSWEISPPVPPPESYQ